MTDILRQIEDALRSDSDARRDEALDAAHVEIARLHTAVAMAKYWRGQYDLLHAHIEKIRAAVSPPADRQTPPETQHQGTPKV
jgi:hypothetical protein